MNQKALTKTLAALTISLLGASAAAYAGQTYQMKMPTGSGLKILPGDGVGGTDPIDPGETNPGGGTEPTYSFSLSHTSVDFSSVEAFKSKASTVTVTNTGTSDMAPLTLSSAAPSFDASLGTCGSATLSPGASCQLDLLFLPTTRGALSGSVTVTSNGISQNLAVQGTGVGSVARWAVTTLDFGTVAVPPFGYVQKTVELFNDGDLTTSFTLNNGIDQLYISRGLCSYVLPGSSCIVTFTYQPDFSGPLHVTDVRPIGPTFISNTLTVTGNAYPE